MNQASVKEFQSNMYLYLKDLPLEITRRGTPIFWIVGKNPEKVATKPKEVEVVESRPTFCEISEANPNINCSRVPAAKYKILYTGGDDPVSWSLWLCEGHSKFQGGDVEVTKI